MDINEVTILGSIKEISSICILKNGQRCCWLDILTDIPFHNENKNGSAGHIQAHHRIIAYGKYADIIKEKVLLDQKIFLQGRMKTNNWEYNGMSFQKTFIVLERFKLQIPPHKELDNIQNDEREWGEYHNEFKSEDYECRSDWDDIMDEWMERDRLTGWPYGDD